MNTFCIFWLQAFFYERAGSSSLDDLIELLYYNLNNLPNTALRNMSQIVFYIKRVKL